MLINAEKRANQIVEEAKQAARTEANASLLTPRPKSIRSAARQESLRSQVAGLAVAGAEKILRKEVDAAKHADLLASIKAEL